MTKFFGIKCVNTTLFVIFTVINMWQPLVADDLNRGILAALYNHKVFHSLVSDYLNWTGRISAQILVYVFFNAPFEKWLIPIFNVINAGLFVVFYTVSFKLVVKNNEQKFTTINYLLFTMIFTLFLIDPSVGFLKNAIWKTVGLQYFWGIVLVEYIFLDFFYKDRSKINNPFVLFIVGLFIGLYNELFVLYLLSSYAGALLFSMLFDGPVKRFFVTKKIMTVVGGLFAGGAFLIAAPGNYARFKIVKTIMPNPDASPLQKVIELINNLYLHKLFAFLIVSVLLFSMCKLVFAVKKHQSVIAMQQLIRVIMILFLLLVYIPFSFHVNEARVIMHGVTVLLILFLQDLFYFVDMTFFTCFPIVWRKIFTVSLSVVNCGIFLFIVNVYYDLHRYASKVEKLILKYQLDRPMLAILPKYDDGSFIRKFAYYVDIRKDSKDPTNVTFAKYYKLKDVSSL